MLASFNNFVLFLAKLYFDQENNKVLLCIFLITDSSKTSNIWAFSTVKWLGLSADKTITHLQVSYLMQKSFIIIILLFFCCYCPTSNARDKIYWFSYDEKNSSLLNQTTRVPTSTVIDTTRLLMKSLPQYQFSVEFAQSPSIARLLKKLPNSCSPNRVKTPERLRDNIFSLPLNIALDLRLYYKGNSIASALPQSALNKDQQLISLASLFTSNSTDTLGIDRGRSLGCS